MTKRLLIIVHPGSCKGSADMNIGPAEAGHFRDAICQVVRGWRGDIAVITGDPDLEEEDAPEWRTFDNTIETALREATERGAASIRIAGPDMEDVNQVDAAREVMKTLGCATGDVSIRVTGAWHHRDLRSGCVTSVFQALQEDGHKVEVSSSALELEPDPLEYKARLLKRYESEARFKIRESENEGALFPDGTPWAFCSNWARWVKTFEGDRCRLYGYAAEDNPTSQISELADGHDFAVVDDRFVIDAWALHVEQLSPVAVLDLEDPADAEAIARLYGDRACWEENHQLAADAPDAALLRAAP